MKRKGRKYRVGDLSEARSVSQADHLAGEGRGARRGEERKCQKSMEIRGSVNLSQPRGTGLKKNERRE